MRPSRCAIRSTTPMSTRAAAWLRAVRTKRPKCGPSGARTAANGCCRRSSRQTDATTDCVMEWPGSRPAILLLRRTIPAGGRRLDDDRFAGVNDGGVGTLEPLHRAIVAPHPVLADLAILAARHAERPDAAVAREDGV